MATRIGIAVGVMAFAVQPFAHAATPPIVPAVTQVQAVTQPARAVAYRPEVRAWARVESVAEVELSMPLRASVVGVEGRPGEIVAAGTPLVRLGGARLRGELAAARAHADAARAELSAATESEASTARSYPALVDRRALAAAHAALAAAEGRLAEANAAQAALEAQTVVASPVAGTIAAVRAAAGSDLAEGAPLITLQPMNHLWLRAEVFGAVPTAGSEARFVASGEPDVAVREVAELPARAADGAHLLNFAASVADPRWQAGEAGEVIIDGAPREAVAVPAAALILDAGRWHVLTDDHGRLVARAVTPGPTRGDDTLILDGLAPGTPVVVREAYLLFHRDLASRYAAPD